MANVTLFTDSVDMTQWGALLADLNDTIGGAGMTTHTASKIVLAGALKTYTLNGAFTYSDNMPSGKITSLAFDDMGGAHYAAITGMSMSVHDLETFGAASDGTGFESTLFHGSDTFTVSGGVDTLNGFAGNDTFNLGSTLTAADSIDGGAGAHDTVVLSGNYINLVLGATTLLNIEKIQLSPGTSYRITTNDANVASGKVLEVDCSGTGFGYTLTFDGSAERNGSFVVKGGNGNDLITGGAKNDTIDGASGHNTITAGNGADTLTVASGNDTLVYTDVRQSMHATFDHIVSFDFNNNDHFDLNTAVAGIDAQVTGVALHTATFDSDMALALGPSQLHHAHAVLVTAGPGNYTGDTFLVIDAGGGIGYQGGKDFVFLLDSAVHIANLDASDFI